MKLGRMKGYTISLANLEVDFLELLVDLLKGEGFDIAEASVHPGPGYERPSPDLWVVRNLNKISVELKLDRAAQA
jgi:hypothetical protein